MLKVKDVRILRKGSLPGMAAISFDSQTHCYHICCYGPSSTSSSHKCFHLYPVLRKRTTTKKIVYWTVHLKLYLLRHFFKTTMLIVHGIATIKVEFVDVFIEVDLFIEETKSLWQKGMG